MKILAFEKKVPNVKDSNYQPFLREEVQKAWNLRQIEIIREIYFNDNQCSVLILKANDKDHAHEILDQLLVRNKLIDFEIHGLTAYSGYARPFSR